jgi:hypothetical protein
MTLTRCLIVAGLILLALQPTAAQAGTFDVYSCTLPNGSRAGIEGWAPQLIAGPGITVANSCLFPPSDSPTGALRADLAARSDTNAYAGWVFSAPKFTTIDNFTLWRTVRTAGNGGWFHDFSVSYGLRGPVDKDHYAEFCTPFGSCSGHGVGRRWPFDPANRLSVSGLQVLQLVAELTCDSTGAETCEPESDHGRFEIYSARIGLADLYPPVLRRPPQGSLVETDEPRAGEKEISFSATDQGAGIEQVGLVVDGTVRVRQPATTASRCRRPFSALVPCLPSHAATLAFDTAQLPNGPHTIQALVVDAARNETRSDPVAITTLNGSQPNGRNASRFVKLTAWLRSKRDKQRRAAVVPYGAVRFAEGRLTDSAGAPIAGAVLAINSRVQRPGARYRASGTVTTSDDGRFAYRIPRGPSRTLRFEYTAFTLDPAPVSTASVSLGVKAGIALKLRPRRVRNGQKITFKGRLRGGPARKGTRVTVDVLVPDARRRVPIGSVKADGKGRFAFGYRFRRTLVKARYRFRARLTPQPGYPYRGATSRRVSVVVSP